METILLVDDERDILDLAHEMLEGEGYEILDALNAEEAVRVAAAHTGPIHLLLTDIVMPGASGQDLAQLLGLQRPTCEFSTCRASRSSRERLVAS
jgi:two-component system, cell cycle sensor histidine kinase and response regulator CckA